MVHITLYHIIEILYIENKFFGLSVLQIEINGLISTPMFERQGGNKFLRTKDGRRKLQEEVYPVKSPRGKEDSASKLITFSSNLICRLHKN